MDKKQEIMEAAFKLFCQKGYHLSLSDLAHQVGLKTPSLYSHFESKDQLLELMINEEIHRYYSFLDETLLQFYQLNCKEALKNLFFNIMEFFSEYERLRFWRAIPLIPNEHLKSTCTMLLMKQDHAYFQRMQQCFLKGMSAGEIRSGDSGYALHLYLCLIQGVLDAMLLYSGNINKSDFAARIFDTYWAGICAVPVNESN